MSQIWQINGFFYTGTKEEFQSIVLKIKNNKRIWLIMKNCQDKNRGPRPTLSLDAIIDKYL